MATNSKPVVQPKENLREDSELATISVSSRIPEFWCDQPRLWFAQCEAVLSSQKLGDEAKFNLLLPKLGKQVIEQVSDIVLNPPATHKYETLKNRLLAVYEESENRQFQKLLGEMELGDQKPSQFLRRMRDLARNKIPDETLRSMWQGHLPTSVRAVLAVSEVKDLDNLAAIADKIMETTRPLQAAEVNCQAEKSDDTSFLMSQIAKLSVKVMKLERSRPRYRSARCNWRRRTTSSGRSVSEQRRPRSELSKWLCFYHHRFGVKAKKCVEPCAWNKQPEN